MKINKIIAIAVLLFALLMSGLAAGVLFSQRLVDVNAAPPAQESDDINEAGEVEEIVSLDETGITADEAKTAAEAAWPGAKAREVELERENGVTAYEVELDNGLEVLVDPANGDILGVDSD